MKNKQNMNTTLGQFDNMENQAAQQSQQNNGNNINTHPEVQMMKKRIDALESE